jgi:hypothetical protein
MLERAMEQPTCERCGGKARFDRELDRLVCGRCGQPFRYGGGGQALVRGAEIVDWLGERQVSRYFVSVEPTPPRDPNRLYLRALRRSYRQRPHG